MWSGAAAVPVPTSRYFSPGEVHAEGGGGGADAAEWGLAQAGLGAFRDRMLAVNALRPLPAPGLALPSQDSLDEHMRARSPPELTEQPPPKRAPNTAGGPPTGAPLRAVPCPAIYERHEGALFDEGVADVMVMELRRRRVGNCACVHLVDQENRWAGNGGGG